MRNRVIHFARQCRRSFYDYSAEPFTPLPGRKPEWVSAKDAVRIIKSGDKVYVHGVAATPTPLLDALAQHAKSQNLTGISLHHIHLEGPAEWTKPEYDGIIRSNCFFISANTRKAVNEGRADAVSIFLSETPWMFRRKYIEIDVALVQCSPPDTKGYCSLGTGVDCTRAAIQNAKYIIGEYIEIDVALVQCSPPDTKGYCSLGTGVDCTRAAIQNAKYIIGEYIEIDVALVQCSPPGTKGYCSLGTSVDCTWAAIQNAKCIIGLANPNMPRTFGDGIIHASHFDAMVYGDYDLYTLDRHSLNETEMKIGQIIAEELVEDGATLQMGIGTIPDAVLASLKHHRDLGVHTEMFSDGVLDLINCNAVTNARKKVHPGKLVSTFCIGSKTLYKFMDDNPMILMGDVSWVNDTTVIKRNPKVTAINSCIEIDLSGQIIADSIGTRMYSGFGGQIDFIRGAQLCEDHRGKPIIAFTSTTKKGDSKIVSVPKPGAFALLFAELWDDHSGKPIIAFTSTTKKGDSKIVSVPKPGAGVVTTRAHVNYVVTEFGIAQLFGRNLRQRAYSLIQIAHPDHREELEKAAFERLHCLPSPD